MKTELLDKSFKVIDSCKTREHCSMTLNYLELVGKAYDFEFDTMWMLYDRLEIVERGLNV